ncbi:hypothetical protein ANN_15224 [Periplaneta americana]|uniref:3'-5' exonuclease domain-containing protein n=1 Tax=Periplaneta americana TaxID=6978 RepID=A0ABQ8SH06_PERAM|nr:hypothetical protein ANN_15224 [Periplaneta americana]
MENEKSSANTMEPPLKRRKGDELKYRQLYYSILDRMHMEITDRFSDYGKLQFTHLLDSQKFSAYRENFPNEALNKLFQSYNSHFDQVRLKNELSVIYSAEVFDFSNKPIHEILSAIYENQLNQVIPEVLKLATLIVTIPATSASVERTFSALKRIKSYCRSTHTQERLSGLALMSIEKSFLQKLCKRPNWSVVAQTLKPVYATGVNVKHYHHSYRSFQGFTCLMQISTRDTDYIIDTLTLRDKLHCLNEIFTKPTIVKVFHGADCDVEWLQRDLCLYVVNMFDTHQAAKALNFAQLSLAYLLKHYCNVYANKHFQLADWRIRPLPEELVMYARQDTHYLLYIYDMMNNALLDAANGKDNLLQSVFRQSTEICKTRYEKPALREDSHMLLYRRNKKLFDNRQLFALRELYRWRDKIARQEDESIGQTIRKIQQVFGEDAMGVTQIKEWFNRFKDGRTSAESEQRCGRPQTARSAAVVERVRNLVMADRRLTVREIAEEVGEQKDSRRNGSIPSLQGRRKRQVRSKIKVMLTVFFDVRGIVHHEYAPEGQMVTRSTITMFSGDSVMQFSAKDQTCGRRTTGTCITTTPPHIHPN